MVRHADIQTLPPALLNAKSIAQPALPFAFPTEETESIAPSKLTKREPVAATIKPPEIIRAEANFLRFPFFALHTKGLRARDGIECVGRKHEGDKVHVFKLSITRNTKHLYPGPLSRKVHVALLSLLQEKGFPYQNPIEWSWPELTARMQITCGGEIEGKLKEAIRRTAGVLITSNYALTTIVGEERHLLPHDEHGYHLYDGYRFRNETLHDGTRADRNCIWLSEWYLANLNGLYSGPLHHETWTSLDRESPIASRLYEFLLFNAKATETLKIDYATLVNFLPVKLERYPSDAERQLAVPFRLLREHGVVNDITWTLGVRGQMQLQLRFGQTIRGISQVEKRRDTLWPELTDDVEIRELRNTDTPAADLVREFHRLWSGNHNYRPLKPELAFAEELMDHHGRKCIEKLLPKIVRVMQRPDGFPSARMFNAARRYVDEVVEREAREKKRRTEERETVALELSEVKQIETEKKSRFDRREELLAIWHDLSLAEQQRIEREAHGRQEGSMLKELFSKSESHRLRETLKELDRQTSSHVA